MSEKRLLKEISILEKANYIIQNYIYYNKTISINLNKKFIIKLQFRDNYPFQMPKVFIIYNKKQYDYINFTHLKYPRYIDQLNSDNIKCFCHRTIICKDWHPSIKILDIINDIKKMNRNISLVIYKSYIKKILDMKNIPLEIMNIIVYYL